jgi:hypothetical protein
MARYFLHLRGFDGDLMEDEEGTDFPTFAAAREYAIAAMGDLVAEAIKDGREAHYEMIVLADEHGSHLASVPVVAPLPATLLYVLKDPAKAVPADRFEEYRRNADGCRHMAENASDPEDKVSWLKLADAWLHMLPRSETASAQQPGWPTPSEEHSKAAH